MSDNSLGKIVAFVMIVGVGILFAGWVISGVIDYETEQQCQRDHEQQLIWIGQMNLEPATRQHVLQANQKLLADCLAPLQDPVENKGQGFE